MAKDMGADPLIRSTAARLRQLEEIRLLLRSLDQVVAELTPADKLILQKLVLHPESGNASLLAELLEVEETTLYRRRAKVLRRLGKVIGGAEE